MGFFQDAGNFFVDIHKASIQPFITTGDLITGRDPYDLEYSTGAGKLAGQIQSDTITVGAQPMQSSFDSITGYHTTNDYQTGLGQTLGDANRWKSDFIHGMLKGVANGATGGLATTLTNTWRSDENKEGIKKPTGTEQNIYLPYLNQNQNDVYSENDLLLLSEYLKNKPKETTASFSYVGIGLMVLLFLGVIFSKPKQKKS